MHACLCVFKKMFTLKWIFKTIKCMHVHTTCCSFLIQFNYNVTMWHYCFYYFHKHLRVWRVKGYRIKKRRRRNLRNCCNLYFVFLTYWLFFCHNHTFACFCIYNLFSFLFSIFLLSVVDEILLICLFLFSNYTLTHTIATLWILIQFC